MSDFTLAELVNLMKADGFTPDAFKPIDALVIENARLKATIKRQQDALDAAKNLVADWRNYRGGYADDEFTDVGKTAVRTHENNAGQLARALAKARDGNMKHIMQKTIEQATSQELLLVLLHTNGMSEGPVKRTYGETVMEALIEIGPDATAYVTVFEDDIESLKELCAPDEVSNEEMRKLASAATGGNWECFDDGYGGRPDGYKVCSSGHPFIAGEVSAENAAYIAATNPLYVVGLLDRLEAAEQALDAVLPYVRHSLPGNHCDHMKHSKFECSCGLDEALSKAEVSDG